MWFWHGTFKYFMCMKFNKKHLQGWVQVMVEAWLACMGPCPDAGGEKSIVSHFPGVLQWTLSYIWGMQCMNECGGCCIHLPWCLLAAECYLNLFPVTMMEYLKLTDLSRKEAYCSSHSWRQWAWCQNLLNFWRGPCATSHHGGGEEGKRADAKRPEHQGHLLWNVVNIPPPLDAITLGTKLLALEPLGTNP